MEINDVIQETVKCTVAQLKISGMMKDDKQSAYQKTLQVLESYNDMKKSHSENGIAAKFVDIIEKALQQLYDDEYYDIIPMSFFEGQSREEIAGYFDTTVTTISRHKRQLVERLSVLLFCDDVVLELFT